MSKPTRIVVVEGTPCINRFLLTYPHLASGLQVVGTAMNGLRATEMVKSLCPDVVTLDLDTPNTDCLEVLDRIMYDCPTPILIVSSVSPHAATTVLAGITSGAIDFILKDPFQSQNDAEAFWGGIVGKIRAASRVRVIRSIRLRQTASAAAMPPRRDAARSYHTAEGQQHRRQHSLERVVVIGASTGGPAALREMLSIFPAHFPAAVIIVQHMPEGFTKVLAAQLDRCTTLAVREALQGDGLETGTVLVAPGDHHLHLASTACIDLRQDSPINGHRPSIDVTMQSLAQVYGERLEGVILTGMGADGADGLMAIHAAGGITLAQDADSCVVDGMPQRARETGLVDYINTPTQIARHLVAAPWVTRGLKI